MKKNNRGFILAESLVVSTFVVTILVVLFVQFNNINKNYSISFTYNTVEGLYAANNMKIYILKGGFESLKSALNTNSSNYVDITNCSTDYLTENDHCNNLVDVLNVKQIIFTNANVSALRTSIIEDENLSPKMKNFINTMSNDVNQEDNRLIIEFNDGTFSTIIVK